MSSDQHEMDIAFLYDISSFAWYNRLVSAYAAYDQIVHIKEFHTKYDLLVEPNRAQKILRMKIFAEYVALLESFGGLCVALKKRNESSIRETFVNIEPYEVLDFYNSVLQSRRENIVKLLKFSPPEKLHKAARAMGLDDIELEDLKASYRHLGVKIKEVARQYVGSNRMLVRYYNKVKHCFPVIEGKWLTPPIPEDQVAVYSVESVGFLTMKQEQTIQHIENMKNITIIGAEFLNMCKCLNDSQLLFD